jgi:putative component of toxin-antitoxin plasmid stabilization module
MEVRRYQAPDGTDPFGLWLASLADARARAAALVRIARVSAGNLGGGDKRRQGRDIETARNRLLDFKRRPTT